MTLSSRDWWLSPIADCENGLVRKPPNSEVRSGVLPAFSMIDFSRESVMLIGSRRVYGKGGAWSSNRLKQNGVELE